MLFWTAITGLVLLAALLVKFGLNQYKESSRVLKSLQSFTVQAPAITKSVTTPVPDSNRAAAE